MSLLMLLREYLDIYNYDYDKNIVKWNNTSSI